MKRKSISAILLILTFGICTPVFAVPDGGLPPTSENVTLVTTTSTSTDTLAPAITPINPTKTVAEVAKVQSPAAARFINVLIDLLAAILLILVPYFVHRLLLYFETKTKIKLSPETLAKIDALLDKGIAYGDEQSHKAIKNNEKALTMSEKLEYGAGYVMDLADKTDIKNWTIGKVKKMLEARLQEKRTEA